MAHPLPTLERTSFEPDPKELILAKKVHSQLTDIILELGTSLLSLYILLNIYTYSLLADLISRSSFSEI
jgi:hypothetical protein